MKLKRTPNLHTGQASQPPPRRGGEIRALKKNTARKKCITQELPGVNELVEGLCDVHAPLFPAGPLRGRVCKSDSDHFLNGLVLQEKWQHIKYRPPPNLEIFPTPFGIGLSLMTLKLPPRAERLWSALKNHE